MEFNSSVTLSQQYAVLIKVAKELGKAYEKSGDQTLSQLAQGYYTMEKEAKHLSKLVEKQLAEFNDEILQSSAILMDDFWGCVACSAGCYAALGGGCFAVCFFTVGLACAICLELLEFPELLLLGCEGFCESIGWCP